MSDPAKDDIAMEEGGDPSMAAALLKNPAVMAALQGKLDAMVGSNSGYIDSLPAPVKPIRRPAMTC